MKNLDILKQKREEISRKLHQAMKDGNDDAFTAAFQEFQENLQEQVMAEAQGLVDSVDATILSARGVRQLTSEERNYFTQLADAMRSADPKQAVTNLEVVMPKTTIDAVFEDLRTAHPLLEAINFQNTSGLIEFLVNTDAGDTAVWGTLTAEIAKELTSGFTKFDMTLNKLSAFIPVAKSMLDLGPEWLDRYVRELLSEGAAIGMEYGIVNGTGKDEPIGMVREVGEDVTVTGGVYPKKDAIAVTDFEPATYGGLVARLAKTPKGKSRVVNEVLLLVNPIDYLIKVMPATTIRNANGTYVNNVFPFPTRCIPSEAVDQGEAVMGLGSRYFMGLGTDKSGKVEYADETRFLEDERLYLVKLYGHGQPKDNNAFLLLDISGLKPAAFHVNTNGSAANIDLGLDLQSLAIGNLALSPAFSPDVTEYTAATTNATNGITAVAGAGAEVSILNGDTPVTSGQSAAWEDGENEVKIQVSKGALTKTYTVTVTKS